MLPLTSECDRQLSLNDYPLIVNLYFVSVSASSTEHKSFRELNKPLLDQFERAWDVYSTLVIPGEDVVCSLPLS